MAWRSISASDTRGLVLAAEPAVGMSVSAAALTARAASSARVTGERVIRERVTSFPRAPARA
jgi:hypothetical protein